MQIEWNGQPAPELAPSPGRAVAARGMADGSGDDLRQDFMSAVTALGRDLAAKEAAPPHIQTLTIQVPDTDAFLGDLFQLDLLYREALGGNFGRVALVEAPGPVTLTAAACIPPVSETAVYRGLSRATLNREYSPRATVPEAPDIMAQWRINGTAFQQTRSSEIRYGSDPAESIDLYMPAEAGGAPPPLHIFIHGGYWQALDKRDNGHLCVRLQSSGIAVATLNYPLCPPGTVGEIVASCQAAVVALYRQAAAYGVDADRITVSGHSAGGHLAGMLAATDWPGLGGDLPVDLIKGTVAISGLFDLEPLIHTGLNNALGLTVEDARRNSPIHLPIVTPGPIVAAVGGAESSEFHRQSSDYAETKTAQGHAVRYLDLPGLNHFTVVEALADTASPLFDTVRRIARRETGDGSTAIE